MSRAPHREEREKESARRRERAVRRVFYCGELEGE